MNLKELLNGLPIIEVKGELDREVDRIECTFYYHFDKKGPFPEKNQTLFVHVGPLLPGDPEEFFSNNVNILVVDRIIDAPHHITVIRVVSTHQIYALLCSRMAGNPSKDLTLIGVTGTNGKSTTTALIDKILQAAGKKTALFGTLHYRIGKDIVLTDKSSEHLTTPFPQKLQELLTLAINKKITHIVMEVTSQGLREHRLDGTSFDVGVFTNFSQEHLDYHLDMVHYFESKASFFKQVLPESLKKNVTACINLSDPKGRNIYQNIQNSKLKTIGFGRRPGPDQIVYCRNSSINQNGIEAKIVTPKGILEIHSPLLGSFNLMNILSAISACLNLDISLSDMQRGINQFKGVLGRLQKIPNPANLHIYCDWAHTVEGFRRVLQLLNSWKKEGKLLTVFGCETAMDFNKRKETAKMAAKFSDELFITLRNLTQEEVKGVKKEMIEGLKEYQTPYQWFAHSLDATKALFKKAQAGDTIVFLGGDLDYISQAENLIKEYFINNQIPESLDLTNEK